MTVKPELLEVLGEDMPPQPPMDLGLLTGDGDRYVVTAGYGTGMRGYFTRAADGKIDGMHVGGRYAQRVAT